MQRTAEWFQKRRNKLTASNVGAALGQVAYVSRKAAYERAIGTDSFEGNIATDWGIAHEEEAIAAYAAYKRCTVQPTGLHQHPTIEWLAGSPDGLVGDDGLLEVKCPYYQLHRGPHQTVPYGYYLQMQQQLQCTDRKWCDYVCYCGARGMSIFHIERDDVLFLDLYEDLETFARSVQARKGAPRQKRGRKRAIRERIEKSMSVRCHLLESCTSTIV